MITCLAIGATIIAAFSFLALLGGLIHVIDICMGVDADVRLHEWIMVIAFAAFSCGSAVWLWHKALAS